MAQPWTGRRLSGPRLRQHDGRIGQEIMILPRILAKWRRFGTIAVLKIIANRAINRVTFFIYAKVMLIRVADIRPDFLRPPEGFQFMFLTPDQCRAFAQDPEYQMPAGFLERSLAKRDRCFACLDGDTLASFAWFTTEPTTTSELFDISFDSAYVYQFQAFTHPRYRGRRLHAYVKMLALDALSKEGCRGLISIVEFDNAGSLTSNRRMGKVVAGWLVIGKAFGRQFIYASRGSRALGFRARPKAWPPIAHPPQAKTIAARERPVSPAPAAAVSVSPARHKAGRGA